MKGRLIAIVATVTAAIGLSSGVFILPAAAAASTVNTAVFDAAGGAAWSGTEVTGASAYDTAVVIPDVSSPAGGTLTYSLFSNGTCSDSADTTQTVTLNGDGTVPNSDPTGALGADTYSFQAVYNGDGINDSSPPPGVCESFTIARANPTAPTISNLPTNATWSPGGGFAAVLSGTDSDGVQSVISSTTDVCTTSGLAVTYVTAGQCTLTAQTAASTNYLAGSGTEQNFTIAKANPTAPSITNLPAGGSYGGGFVSTVSTDGDGTKSVKSDTTAVCTVGSDGLTVSYVGVGMCSLNSQVAAGTEYAGATGEVQSFTVARATPSSPVVSNIPGGATEFGSFTGSVSTTGDGTGSITSSTGGVCTVGPDGLTVSFVSFGTCTLTASVGQGSNYLGRTGAPQTFTVNPAARGYWLVGSDGGIFSFGAAGFHGSMGGIPLQRPVVGITPTASRNGYWLVASDGGIFAFGDSVYYGSIPGLGLHPAGSGQPDSLDAPIVGMVPSTSRHGYFMVASDGGVFAFGDARFEGSCPGIGGCDGAAVAVMPDSTGNGYWLITDLGAVYAFGDAANYGEPPAQSVPAVDAVATPDGHGYWVLYANGAVFGFGDAAGMGAPLGYVNSFNPAAAIFPTADGKGYWVAAARGDVFSYGDAPFMGSMAAAGLNGDIIAGSGF